MATSVTNRILVGSFLILFILLTYYFNLDFVLYFSIFSLIFYDLYKSKLLFKIDLNFFLIQISLFIFLFFINFYLLIFFILIFVIISFFYNKLINNSFIFYVLLFFICFFKLGFFDRNLLYQIIFISFLNDTFAFIFGKTLKGPLIIPSITPNKTWSGTLVSFFLSFLTLLFLEFTYLISFIISISLFLGDLYFSYIKRSNKLKDFSNILSGHGGLFDRIDSMTLITILFFLIVS